MERIRIDFNKCTGCRMCEVACSLSHLPSEVNPRRARIRVLREGEKSFPNIAGPYTEAGCNSQLLLVVDGETFDKCALCRASCPMKPIFKDTDGETPLKCDFCGLLDSPGPSCVKWCHSGALTLVDTDF